MMESLQSYLMNKNYGVFKKVTDVILDKQDASTKLKFSLPRIVIVGNSNSTGHLYLLENFIQEKLFNRDDMGKILPIHNTIKIRFVNSIEEKIVISFDGNEVVRSKKYSGNLLTSCTTTTTDTDNTNTEIILNFFGTEYPSNLEIIALPAINTKYLKDDTSIIIPVIDAPRGEDELEYVYNLPLLKILHIYKKQNHTIIALRGLDKVDPDFLQDNVMDLLIPEITKPGI